MSLKQPSIIRTTSRVLAMDCGASHVNCATFAVQSGRRVVLEQFQGELITPTEAGDEEWCQAFGHALAKVRGRLDGPRTCHLALAGHHTLSKFIRLAGTGTRKDRAEMLREVEQCLPLPPCDLTWGCLPLARAGAGQSLMVSMARKRLVDGILAKMAATGWEARRIEPAALVLLRGFRYNYPDVTDNILILDVGAAATQMIFVECRRFFFRCLPFGDNAVTAALATELKIPPAEAENVKLGRAPSIVQPNDTAARAAVRRAFAAFAERIGLEFRRTSFYCRQHGGPADPVAVYFSGGGTSDDELQDVISVRIGLRGERIDGLRAVEKAKAVGDVDGTSGGSLINLVGLAVGRAAAPCSVDLSPREAKTRRQWRDRGRLALMALVAAAGSLSAAAWQCQQRSSVLVTRLSGMREQIAAARATSTAAAEAWRRVESAKRDAAVMTALIASKYCWVRFLADLQHRLVEIEDVWLERLQLLPQETPGVPPVANQRVTLKGCLLDRANPNSKVSPQSYDRVKTLLESFAESDFVSAIEDQRFDNSQPGILRFDVTLAMNPDETL